MRGKVRVRGGELLKLVLVVIALAFPSSSAARTLVAEPKGIESGPALASDGVAWTEGGYARPIALRYASPGSEPQTLTRIGPPEGPNEFHGAGALSGSGQDLAFVRHTFRSVMSGDSGGVTLLGADLYGGQVGGSFDSRASGTFSGQEPCFGERAVPEDSDLDEGHVVLLEEVQPCMSGELQEPTYRASVLDLANGTRTVLAEGALVSGPGDVRIEDGVAAWWHYVGPRDTSVVSVFDHTKPAEIYSLTIDGVSAIDVQGDGKLAVMKRRLRDGLSTARSTPIWFSPEDPYEHPLPFKSTDTASVEISGDHLVFGSARPNRSTQLVVSTVAGEHTSIARLGDHRKLGAAGRIDFDGSSLTYAERKRTASGARTRIYLERPVGER